MNFNWTYLAGAIAVIGVTFLIDRWFERRARNGKPFGLAAWNFWFDRFLYWAGTILLIGFLNDVRRGQTDVSWTDVVLYGLVWPFAFYSFGQRSRERRSTYQQEKKTRSGEWVRVVEDHGRGVTTESVMTRETHDMYEAAKAQRVAKEQQLARLRGQLAEKLPENEVDVIIDHKRRQAGNPHA